MTPDTLQRREIRQKPAVLFMILGVMLIFAVLCLVVAVVAVSPGTHAWTPAAIAVAGVGLFGWMSFQTLRRLRFGRGVVIILSPEGFCDRRLSKSIIPWTDVRRVEIRGIRHPEVMLELTDAAFARLYPVRWLQHLHRINRFGAWVPSPSVATETGRDAYRDLLRAYVLAHGGK